MSELFHSVKHFLNITHLAGADRASPGPEFYRQSGTFIQCLFDTVSRANELSGSVARNLSGFWVRHEASR
ncbi:hypothetical protein, partial [Burkholderia sp. BDU5]|uniref:hypothetical protein n=1 Tax=Burkholderia sp. BDU5 TaxID=1385590 RepID=UPI001E2CB8F5